MVKKNKQLSNPFSTGGGGGHFEAHVQASFVVLMLTGGYAPCLPCWPITEIKLQGKIDGFYTDDLIVYVKNNSNKEQRKILCQVKHSVHITQGDSTFAEVARAAWNDFNNPNIFTKEKDIIALVTGPQSATDSRNVNWLFDQARYTKNSSEFYRNVQQANFSPNRSAEKLDVIQHHIKAANNNIDIDKEDFYLFLKHFHILVYDLGREAGVVLSLLHSHLSQFNKHSPELIWSRIVEIVQCRNQIAGTITTDKLPDDLKDAFKQPIFTSIPPELSNNQPETSKEDWDQHPLGTFLALFNLIGGWNEKNKEDIFVLSKLIDQNYEIWAQKIREILLHKDTPFSLRNGIWSIKDRGNLWTELGRHIFDQNLDKFKTIAVTVLTELNPAFKLPATKRFAASVYGKALTHSQALREGLAEGLALLGSKPRALSNCSLNHAEATAVLGIREIFANADWMLWGSLDRLLPLLAEAAPVEFLDTVEKALNLPSCPFDKLFSQEGDGFTGGNYLTGLLWALEGIAWEEKYLVRVCIILGELASHDPGGNWSNRPINSLSTLLLPWSPQTLAPIEKRKVSVQTLSKEFPDIAWKLVISLLPNQHQISMGSYKPKWRNTIPDNKENGVTEQDYWLQVSHYAETAVSLATNDTNKLVELIDHLDKLPRPSFDRLLETISAESILGLPEYERQRLWDRLTKFTSKHRRYAEAQWSLSDELLSNIELVAGKIAPLSPFHLYQHLFSNRDFDLYEESGPWEEQKKRLEDRRINAINEIVENGNIQSVVQFAEVVESPNRVGHSLAHIANAKTDMLLLPEYLESQNHNHSLFINSYVWSRHNINGWTWADRLEKSNWSQEQVGLFLSYLPFSIEAWRRADALLGESQGNYWSIANSSHFQDNTGLDIAIDKLLQHGRPYAAIDCLYRLHHYKFPIKIDQCTTALISALSSTELSPSIDAYHTVELIKMLQNTQGVTPEVLFKIEWAYLPLLDDRYNATPKSLEQRLASDPDFFSEIIRLIYRSKKSEPTASKPTEKKKAIATMAWRLLNSWKTPPGIQEDGTFNDFHFSSWLQKMKVTCTKSGHLEVALSAFGEVIINCPPDGNGLWINNTVASALNAKDADDIRNGFRTGIINSRGAHYVDPTAKPEIFLATEYQKKAEEAENSGHQRFATTLRSLSEFYNREAETIIAKNKHDSLS